MIPLPASAQTNSSSEQVIVQKDSYIEKYVGSEPLRRNVRGLYLHQHGVDKTKFKERDVREIQDEHAIVFGVDVEHDKLMEKIEKLSEELVDISYKVVKSVGVSVPRLMLLGWRPIKEEEKEAYLKEKNEGAIKAPSYTPPSSSGSSSSYAPLGVTTKPPFRPTSSYNLYPHDLKKLFPLLVK